MSVQRFSVEMVANVLISLLTTSVTVLVDMKANSVMLVSQQFQFMNLSTHSFCVCRSKKSMNVFPILASTVAVAHIKSISIIVIVILDTLVCSVKQVTIGLTTPV